MDMEEKIAVWPANSRYGATAEGVVFDLKPKIGIAPRILRQHLSHEGYWCVNIWSDQKGRHWTTGVHVVVGETFLPPRPPDKPMVRHVNDIKTDNRIENLAWGDEVDNWKDRKANGNGDGIRGEDNVQARLDNQKIAEIRFLCRSKVSQRKIGAMFGIAQQHVSKIFNHKRWGHIKDV